MIARFVMASVVVLAVGFCAGDDKKDDKDRLQGEWVVVSAEVSGKEAEGIKGKKLVVKGDEWTPPTVGALQFKFKLDAAKNPKHLDLMAELGGKEQTWPGIYKIEGDTFTLCRTHGPGGERPTEFKGGPGVFLMVCKRAEKK
ncbi:MAG TPA: TIGR03067 domain-containing protein [Gemmataceae bacterium]|nr:TIGR03067 domain-containing protein [Gemmataceae bacterium]